MFKLLKYLKWQEWLLLILTIAIVGGQVYLNICIPEVTLEISKYLTMPDISAYWKDIVIACMKMLGFAVGVVLAAIVVNTLSSLLVTNLLSRVRGEVFRKVNNFSLAEINKFSIPSLITRSTNDITQLQQVYASTITMGFSAPLTAILAISKIVSISNRYDVGMLTWVNVISVILISILVFVIVATVVPKFKTIQRTTDSLNRITRENLTGLKVVRANSAEKSQEEKFDEVNQKFTKLDIFVGKVMSIIDPALSIIMQGTSLAIVWIIGLLAQTNPALLTIMSTFTQYSISIIMSFTSLSVLFMFIPRGIVSAKRINQVLDTKTSIVNGQIENGHKKGTIEFKNVSFKYPDADANIIENVSFKVEQGQTIAFIGSTGSGKSTLINLIPRFYDCTDGEVLINGENVKNYDEKALHEIIGYVPQKGVLFSGTVKQNILYGAENATEEDLDKAIKVSQSDFAYNFEDGLEHHISQGGKNVSGGQKQRLSIARALVKNPDILIFDDSFSALDYKTDKIVRENLAESYKDATKVIVAQRIGTIMNADKIIVLNEGKVVGEGTHSQLMKSCEVYQEIALSQLSKEKLENE